MKREATQTIPRLILIASILCALCVLRTEVAGQGIPSYIIILPSVGLAPNQSLRFTLFNGDVEPVHAQVHSRNPGGAMFLMADGSVRPLAFRTFELLYSDLIPAGDSTGRVQLLPSISIIAYSSRPIGRISVTMETVSDGTSNTIFLSEVYPSTKPSSEDPPGDPVHGAVVGIVQGQKIRVTVFNPGDTMAGHIKVFDNRGSQINQSIELEIPTGEFRSFDIDRNELAIAGDPATGRAQVRVQPFYSFRSNRLNRAGLSIEVIDNQTGKTHLLTGSECLVFFLGGLPN